MRRCTQSRRNLCIDGKNLLLFSSFLLHATHSFSVTENHGERIFPWFVEPARPRIGCGIRFAVTACALRVCQSSRESILLMREWIAQRGQASVEARNDDDPSKMKEEEWRGGARLSFLMSIGSDSLLNAAMISRSGRGRTRPRSLARWFTRSRFDTRGCWSVSLLLLRREESVRHTRVETEYSLGEYRLDGIFRIVAPRESNDRCCLPLQDLFRSNSFIFRFSARLISTNCLVFIIVYTFRVFTSTTLGRAVL